jgi:Zn-dependent peptidase ImmA (M78 family)
MLINTNLIKASLDKANEINNLYQLFNLVNDGIPKSVDDLTWVCSEYFEKSIEILELEDLPIHKKEKPPKQWAIRGFYLSYSDRYEIYILAGQNKCWSRFVRAKELFHMLLDAEEFRTTDLVKHITEVGVAFNKNNSKPGKAVVSERMAEIAAMEFLFPMEHRKLVTEHLGSIDNYEIAEKYKIPQYYMEMYLSEPYMEVLGKFYKPPTQKTPSKSTRKALDEVSSNDTKRFNSVEELMEYLNADD